MPIIIQNEWQKYSYLVYIIHHKNLTIILVHPKHNKLNTEYGMMIMLLKTTNLIVYKTATLLKIRLLSHNKTINENKYPFQWHYVEGSSVSNIPFFKNFKTSPSE